MSVLNLSKYFLLFVVTVITLMLTGCKTGDTVILQPNTQSEVSVLGFDASKGTLKYANVGDALFVSGKIAMHKCLVLNKDISTIVRTVGYPHTLVIKSSNLLPYFETEERYLYIAKEGEYNTSWLRGDEDGYCGISVDKKTSDTAFFLYGHNINKVFETSLTKGELALISFLDVPIKSDSATAYKKIIFDGFYNNLFHFTLIEKVGTSLEKKEFKFNPSGGLTTTVSFKGLLLKIHGVDNLGLKYEWLNPEDGIKDENDSLGFEGA
jgi:hypothetical protein